VPFDSYSGTLSQYVDRLVNLLTSQTESPFSVAAEWGDAYKWYALQYTDPDGYTNNNIYIIIGPTAFRTTTRTAYSSYEYSNWMYCYTGSSFGGHPQNVYGIFVGITTAFDAATFSVPTTASMYATFGLRAYEQVVINASGFSPTACNNATVPYRYLDLQSTFYTWYDRYGFTFIQIPQPTVYRDVPFTMHVYRVMPFDTSFTFPWWVLFTDQTVFHINSNTYSSVYNRFPPYPTNLCGRLTYTTSATGYGICMDNPSALNMPPSIASYLTSTNTYVHTFASAYAQRTRPCPHVYSIGPRAPMSFYSTQIRRPHDASVVPCIFMPYGELMMLPTSVNRLNGRADIFRPIISISEGVHPWALTGVFGRVTTLFPIAYVDSGISPGDVVALPDSQYVAVMYTNIEQDITFSHCLGDDTNAPSNSVNADYVLYALRYA